MTVRGSLILLLLLGGLARAEDPKELASKAIARAKDHHKAGRLDEALKELTLAYALDPQKDLLYGIAQIHVKLGQCPEAVTFYRRYLAAKPDPGSAAKAQQAIDACGSNTVPKPVEPKPPVTIEPPKPIEPPRPIEPPIISRPPPKRSPWYTDVLGDVLVGGGVIAGVTGAVLYRSAVNKRDAADDAPTYPEYLDKLDSARSTRTIAIVAGAAGGALIIGGVIRYMTRRDRSEARVDVSVAPLPGGGMIAWSGRL